MPTETMYPRYAETFQWRVIPRIDISERSGGERGLRTPRGDSSGVFGYTYSCTFLKRDGEGMGRRAVRNEGMPVIRVP